ncbi:MAG: DUF1778 domain-containing protein [Candidatus Obscuribacterales bacterium]|nr:DUF1778 domain-containing protein [Candidatus Obscuribacterales bacterium]
MLLSTMGIPGLRGKKKERIALRATDEQKSVIEHAALLNQTTVSDFILNAAYARARKVIQRNSSVVLTTTDWRILSKAVEYSRLGSAAKAIIKRKAGHLGNANGHADTN